MIDEEKIITLDQMMTGGGKVIIFLLSSDAEKLITDTLCMMADLNVSLEMTQPQTCP